MANLYTTNVFFPLSKETGGEIVNVHGDRELGTGEQLRVTTKSARNEIKAVLESLRGSTTGVRRRNDHYLLAQVPAKTEFFGLSHGLAFALAEFLLAHARAPSRYSPGQREPVVPQDELIIVATGMIDDAGKVMAVGHDEMQSKISAILLPAAWPSGVTAEANLKVFVFPKANDRDDIRDSLQRLREAGWTIRPIEDIGELADLYNPAPRHHEFRPTKRRSPAIVGFGLGLVFAAKIVALALLVQDTPTRPVQTAVTMLDGTPSAPATPLPHDLPAPPLAVPITLPVAQLDAIALAYGGRLELDVVPIRGDGSLGPVLAEAHPFKAEDRIGLILRHTGSDRKALAILRSRAATFDLIEAVIEPGHPVLRKSFDVRDLVGAGGEPVLYAIDCASDCLDETDAFRTWIETSASSDLPRRAGIGDGTTPLVMNVNLQLRSSQ